MAVTTITSGLKVRRYSRKFFKEYVRESLFGPYMGESENDVIYVTKELEKGAGDNITYGLVTELKGDGVEGDDTLEGQEEALGNYDDTVTVNQLRHAVIVGKMEQKRTLLEVLDAGRERLKKWCMAKLRDLIIDRLECVNLDGVTTFGATSEADKDAWLTAQTAGSVDRILFGTLFSNLSAGDFSASLLNVDTTDDTLDRTILGKMKRMAKNADPHITPTMVKGPSEKYVAFCGTNPKRDLDADLDTVHQDAGPRSRPRTTPSSAMMTPTGTTSSSGRSRRWCPGVPSAQARRPSTPW
ncbi:MAG: DUF4043 family protein [Deltaproteobacteria bacterium]|nr:DUF4043 family protein [Deltaproteobacteria bacterium]